MLPLAFTPFTFAQSTQSITNPTSVLSIFLSLLLVVAIIFSLGYIMRRFNVTHASNGQMKVVASMMAGAKERIMVIEVGDEQHLIGVTSQSISHLSKLDTPLEVRARTAESQALFKDKLVKAMASRMNPGLKGADNDQR